MKVNQIIHETTSGSVATVAKPLGEIQKRPDVKGLKPVDKAMSGKNKKKGPYANSLLEGKVKELQMDLSGGRDGLNDADFKKKYGKTKQEMRKVLQDKPKSDKPVQEAKLDEDDLILIPGQGAKRKTGFVQHGQSRVDHEVEMARSDVLATMKNAKAIYELLRDRSEDEGLEGWVQEKLIKANDYLNSVKEYYDEKNIHQEMSGGVIAGGGVGEGMVGGYPFNANDPRNWAKKKAYDNRMAAKADKPLTMKDMFSQPKSTAPKLTLDAVWRKVEDVVGQIFPDGDPIDYLAPWLEKHGIRDFKIGEILDRAAKKNGYKDLYDYYDSMKDQYARDNVAENAKPYVPGSKTLSVNFNNDPKQLIQRALSGKASAEYMMILFFDLAEQEGYLKDPRIKKANDEAAVIAYKSGLQGTAKDKVFNQEFFKSLAKQNFDAPNQQGVAEGSEDKTAQQRKTERDKQRTAPAQKARNQAQRKGLQQDKDGTYYAKEGVAEGAKVDRMVKHIAKSERGLGKSKDEAENIAWATANKRGMLDNKNKKGK
jgi:hypothetical protein